MTALPTVQPVCDSVTLVYRLERERAHYDRRADRIAELVYANPMRYGDEEWAARQQFADGARWGLDLALQIVRTSK